LIKIHLLFSLLTPTKQVGSHFHALCKMNSKLTKTNIYQV
jgi:hypothetical protein